MKGFVFIISLFFLFVDVAAADRFQIVDGYSGFYVNLSPLFYVYGEEGLKFIDRTDNLGRIVVNWSMGSHRFMLRYDKEEIFMNLNFDGTTNLKTVYLPYLTRDAFRDICFRMWKGGERIFVEYTDARVGRVIDCLEGDEKFRVEVGKTEEEWFRKEVTREVELRMRKK